MYLVPSSELSVATAKKYGSLFYQLGLAGTGDWLAMIIFVGITALLCALEDPDTDRDKLHKFVEFNFGTPRGNAAEKIADAVIRATSAQ